MLCWPTARLSSRQRWFRCSLSHPFGGPVSSAVTWLPDFPPDIKVQRKGLDSSFPPTPFPCPFPFPQLKGGGNMNPTFKALGWGLGNCLWSWVVGSWVFVQVCTCRKLYEEFPLVGALTLIFFITVQSSICCCLCTGKD